MVRAKHVVHSFAVKCQVTTLCPSGLRGWTQVPLAQAAWVQIPQVSSCLQLASVFTLTFLARALVAEPSGSRLGRSAFRLLAHAFGPFGAFRLLAHALAVRGFSASGSRLAVGFSFSLWLCQPLADTSCGLLSDANRLQRSACLIGTLVCTQARLAQSVERKALNLVVVGSSPTVGGFWRIRSRSVFWVANVRNFVCDDLLPD